MNNQNSTIETITRQNFKTLRKPSGSQTTGFFNDDFSCNPSQNNSHPKNYFLSDESLYHLCQTFGKQALEARRKFAGLLPEVFKRRLYAKKGFSSIFEFSKKLAGIVSIAKPDNEMFLATQVQILSKSAVETLVRDEKFAMGNGEENISTGADLNDRNGLQKSFFEPQSLPGQTSQIAKNEMNCPADQIAKNEMNGNSKTLNLSPEVHQKLLELQQKGLDVNALLLEFLQKREQEIAERKEKISQEILAREEVKPATKHVPIIAQKILAQEYGTKCSAPGCQRPAKVLHHTQRFALAHSHDPRFLAPLCKEHHEIAHSIDVSYREVRQRISGRQAGRTKSACFLRKTKRVTKGEKFF